VEEDVDIIDINYKKKKKKKKKKKGYSKKKKKKRPFLMRSAGSLNKKFCLGPVLSKGYYSPKNKSANKTRSVNAEKFS